MATSKSSSGAASKSAAGKKSSAPLKSSGRSSGGASTSSARGGSPTKNSTASKAAVKSASKPAVKSASKAAVKSTGNAASKSAAAPRSTATKPAAATGRGAAAKAPAGGGRGASAARGGNTASRNTSARASSSKSTAATADPRNDLEKILQDLMKDIYYAEKKLGKALGKMSKNATNPKLKEAFTTHQTQTEDQVSKLEEAFGLLGLTPKAVKCAAMDGLLEEANEHIEEYKKGAGLDAALIVGAQKVEHYEIAAYGSMRSFAATLGYDEAAAIFEEIREQESDTDELLTTLAESIINLKAEEETEDVSDSAKSDAGSGGDADSKAGEDSSSADSGGQGSESGPEGGDDASSSDTEGGAISGMTDGNNREGASETGAAMGY